MTPDDITRLADSADARAKWGRGSLTTPVHDSEGTSLLLEVIAAELRTLARQGKAGGMHVPDSGQHRQQAYDRRKAEHEGKAGGVPEVCSACGTTDGGPYLDGFGGSHGCPKCYGKKATPPANPPEAGVTDEMVECALTAWFHDDPWAAVQAEFDDGGDRFRSDMRAALTAALAPQPKDAT